MSLHATRRGRPKGSGIDDQKFLADIAAMIAAKPDLKPTTAIKALGVTDPSAIRRLRDKFHQFTSELINSEDTTPVASEIPGPAAVASTSTHRCLAAEISRSGDARALSRHRLPPLLRRWRPSPQRAPLRGHSRRRSTFSPCGAEWDSTSSRPQWPAGRHDAEPEPASPCRHGAAPSACVQRDGDGSHSQPRHGAYHPALTGPPGRVFWPRILASA